MLIIKLMVVEELEPKAKEGQGFWFGVNSCWAVGNARHIAVRNGTGYRTWENQTIEPLKSCTKMHMNNEFQYHLLCFLMEATY